jgi:NitT/TauT family transport system ATP-binding protein
LSRLSIQNVTKIYTGNNPGDEPVFALQKNSFEIEKDEFCSILGHSGCGKTTMLNLIAGFETPTEGRVLLDGKPVGGPSWERSVIFQDYALFPWLTVRQNVEFGLVMKGIPKADRDSTVQRHIKLVGLEGFESRLPQQLSGGMRQRVAVARALVISPRVLLMD